jgi:hypothetical protein
MNDRIEKRIELKAPLSRVWRAITDSREFGTWFRVNIEGPFIAGRKAEGQITHPGYEHVRWKVLTGRLFRGDSDTRRIPAGENRCGHAAGGHRERFRQGAGRAARGGIPHERQWLGGADEEY